MSGLPHLNLPMPAETMQWSFAEVFERLEARLGTALVQKALQAEELIPSPLIHEPSADWIKTANFVGINVRTIGSFWKVIPYALSLPACQSAIHLLPIWEPGVVDSLYGMASWRINPEFFSTELAAAQPSLDTVEKQLKATVNLLHALGKTVGMDVIPHTDRYSEIVLSNPSFFEWLRRDDLLITSQSAQLYQEVEFCTFEWLQELGPAMSHLTLPRSVQSLFYEIEETQRLHLLFGPSHDAYGRNLRRGALVKRLFEKGFEPVPATMGPPYRGLEVDAQPAAQTVDEEGRRWRDYKMQQPGPMSRVFGPLTRYKLYEAIDDNKDWAIDFSQPRHQVWQYVCEHYAEVARTYQLDFMRGDMSHVQMRPEGVPLHTDEYYDIHRAVKQHIQQEKPWFGYFAESFLAAPGIMAYGDEVEHLEQARAEATLGDLQSMVLGSETFMSNFRRYLDIAQTRRVTPCLTMMTGDKDDPRFDEFYLAGNEIRMFTGLFITDWPSYMALGFECRNTHLTPAANEFYTKLYVFKIATGDKATRGPYQWGNNQLLFEHLTAIRLLADELLPAIEKTTTHWLLPPDPTAGTKIIAWTQAGSPKYIFVANMDTAAASKHAKIPKELLPSDSSWSFLFGQHTAAQLGDFLPAGEWHFELPLIGAGGIAIFEQN